MVSIDGQECSVEFERSCVRRQKSIESVTGYTKGKCKKVVNEKCFRRVRGKFSKISLEGKKVHSVHKQLHTLKGIEEMLLKIPRFVMLERRLYVKRSL